MRLSNREAELFEAFSRLSETPQADERLLSCDVLSKAPAYGQVLHRYMRQLPPCRFTVLNALSSALRYTIVNFAHLLFMLFVRLAAPSLRKFPLPTPAPGKQLFCIDTFALLPVIAQENSVQDRYLPGLEKAAVDCGHTVLRLYRLYGSRSPLTVLRALRMLVRKQNACTDIHLLAPTDWLRLIAHIFLYPPALFRLTKKLRNAAPGTPEAYIREALLHSAGNCILAGEARRLAGYRLGLALAHLENASITSWYENQTTDKALHRGLHLAARACGKKIPTTGAQLLIWPPTLLNNHPDDREAALGLTPDRILVNGLYFLPKNSTQHYAVGPSLRYPHLFHSRPGGKRTQQEHETAAPLRLLVLLSYHPEEIQRALEAAESLAATPLGANAVLACKFHPATNPADYMGLLPQSAELVSGSLMPALENVDAVIGSGSGALAEAAALGFPVLCVAPPPGTDAPSLNYMPDFGEGVLWKSVSAPQDVAPALEQLMQQASAPSYAAVVRKFRDQLFTEPTPERIREAFRL